MMTSSELWQKFRLLQGPDSLTEAERAILEKFLREEHRVREERRLAHLLKMSGLARPRRLEEFDWTFNPRIPREKIMEYAQNEFLRRPSNLILVGPAGVGKTHLASALCHRAVQQGQLTVFTTLYDFTARLAKARNVYHMIDYFAKVPVLCLDELGYVVPPKEQADALFQIISKRNEIKTTIITTNLIPSQWGKVFDGVTASAILDRLTMNGHFIILEGKSYRSKR